MSDRRRDKRYRFTGPAECVLRTFPDGFVRHAENDIWVALSRDGAVVGETLVLDVTPIGGDAGERRQQFPVYVVDSQPVIVDGGVRYCLRLLGSDRDQRPILFEQQIRRG